MTNISKSNKTEKSKGFILLGEREPPPCSPHPNAEFVAAFYHFISANNYACQFATPLFCTEGFM